MVKARYEYCPVCAIRAAVEQRLEVPAYKPAHGDQRESPAAFWARVEGAGLLSEALAVYDQLVAEQAAWAHTRRESKKQFAARVEREGRQAEAERLRTELLAKGLSEREVQEELVRQLQPLNGTRTRVWPTPNPWNEGRFCLKKTDQEKLLALMNGGESRMKTEEVAVVEAKSRLLWGKHRAEERRALVAARQRAQAAKGAVPKIAASPRAAPAAAPEPPVVEDQCSECGCSDGIHERHCKKFVYCKTPHPCDR